MARRVGIGKKRADTLRSRRHREQRARRKKLVRAGIMLLVLSLIGGSIALLRSESLQVHAVKVSGEGVDHEALEAYAASFLAGSYAFVIPKTSSALLSEDSIERGILRNNLNLKEARVETENGELVIEVEERVAESLWCTDTPEGITSPCMFMDDRGFAFGEAPLFSSSPFVVYAREGAGPLLGKTFLDEEMRQILDTFLDALNSLGLKTVGVLSAADGSVEISLGESQTALNSTTLIIDLAEEVEELPERVETLMAEGVLDEVLEQEGDNEFAYVDLRFGNKIFYRVGSVPGVSNDAPDATPEPDVEIPVAEPGDNDLVETAVSDTPEQNETSDSGTEEESNSHEIPVE